MCKAYASGLFAGVAIGVIVGFLYAPRSGKETREQIKEGPEYMIGKAREKIADTTHKVEQKIAKSNAG